MSSDSSSLSPRMVHLVRHGEAMSKAEDPRRPLTEQGRQAAEQVAAWAAKAGVRVDEIRHSGKLRAEQTATIFAEHLHVPSQPTAARGLDPDDDVRPVADSLSREDATVMLVGHLPFLSRLTSQLVVGNTDRAIVEFDAAALVVLSRCNERWIITAAVQPGLLH